jgi:hypothetical protein
MIKLCPPSIIYIIFSATQILIDTFNGLYNTAFMKAVVMIMVSLLLNILCEQGYSIVSWIIVFIPFILMTFIVTILLYIFGLDASTGTLNTKCKSNISPDNKIHTDSLGNIIIYDPEYNSIKNPVYFKSPNIIIPNPHNNNNNNNNNRRNNRRNNVIVNNRRIPTWSSDPAYQS